MEKVRLSPSRVNDYLNCPQLYKYRAIDQLPEGINLDAERGKLVHKVLEALFDLQPSQRTFNSAVKMVPGKWSLQREETPELYQLIPEEKEWFDRVESLLRTYFTLETPSAFNPTNREMHLEIDLAEAIYLHGYVDRLDIAPGGEVRIVDYKTGKSPRSGWEDKALFQLRIYALIYWRNTGTLPQLLQLIYLGDGQLLKSTPTEADLLRTEDKLLAVAKEIIDSIDTSNWVPKKSRLCDWCSFKPICPAHQK